MGVIMNDKNENQDKTIEYCINLAIILNLYKKKLLTEKEIVIVKEKLKKQAV